MDSTNDPDNCPDEIADHISSVCVIESFLECLDGDVKENHCLIFFPNADKESVEIKLSSVSFENTLLNLSKLDLLWRVTQLLERFFSQDGLGCSHSEINTELLPVTFLVLDSGILDLVIDLNTVDQEVLADVVDEAHWASEDLDHGLKLLEVNHDSLAVTNSTLDILEHLGNDLDSILDFLWVVALEVFHEVLSILEDLFGVVEALSNVSEAFGVEGSLEDTSNDLLQFFHIIGLRNLSLLSLVGWLEQSTAFMLSKSLIEGFDAKL